VPGAWCQPPRPPQPTKPSILAAYPAYPASRAPKLSTSRPTKLPILPASQAPSLPTSQALRVVRTWRRHPSTDRSIDRSNSLGGTGARGATSRSCSRDGPRRQRRQLRQRLGCPVLLVLGHGRRGRRFRPRAGIRRTRSNPPRAYVAHRDASGSVLSLCELCVSHARDEMFLLTHMLQGSAARRKSRTAALSLSSWIWWETEHPPAGDCAHCKGFRIRHLDEQHGQGLRSDACRAQGETLAIPAGSAVPGSDGRSQGFGRAGLGARRQQPCRYDRPRREFNFINPLSLGVCINMYTVYFSLSKLLSLLS
jgi:hypothetical protein